MSKRQLKVFTDGAIHQRGKVGGWAAVVIEESQVTKAIAGRELDTTSNRMELQAAIESIEFVDVDVCPLEHCDVELTSDSQYLVYGASQWLAKWKDNNWRGSSGKVQNRDLWPNKEINDSPEKLIDFIADHIMSELSNIIIFDDMTKEDPITIDPKMAAAMAILGEEFERQKKEEGK